MVEKIIINPEEVRAYGNIIEPKEDTDFILYESTLETSTDTIGGETVPVFELNPDFGELTVLTLTTSSATVVLNGSVTLTATLKDEDNAAINGATITFKDGSTTLGTSTTNSSGVATYTYTASSVGSHTLEASFGGDATYASSNANTNVTVLDHLYTLAFDSANYTTSDGNVTAYVTLQDNSVAVSGASVSLSGTGISQTATTNSSGVATFSLTGISQDLTLTASYGTTTATCTVTYEPFGFEDDFSSGLSNKWVPFGATPSTSVSGGVLTLSKNGNRGGIYYDKLITGDYKVTVSVQSGTYDTYAVGLNTTTGGWNYYELQPKYSYGYFFIDSSGSTTETHYSRQSASYSSATLVFEVTKDTSIKVYVNGTLKATYNIQDTTTDGYVGIVQCCNRSTQVNSIKVEAL